jgi:hypothetical protein
MKSLKYKKPRDPNTQSVLPIKRTVGPEEKVLCQVGGGECREPATACYDDEEGGEFFACAAHVVEMEAFGKLVAEMPPVQLSHLSELIIEAENKRK